MTDHRIKGILPCSWTELCRASGCSAFLKKPVDPGALYTAIQDATNAIPRQFIRLDLLPAVVGDNLQRAAAPSISPNWRRPAC